MKTSNLGIESLDERVVLTAGVGGMVSETPVVEPVAGGWGMAQYQYGFEGSYNRPAPTDTPTDLKGQEPSGEPIVFVGGYGAASYQYSNETTYDNAAAIDKAMADALMGVV